MLPARTVRCADCYAVMYADEMNRCSQGHWSCPGCACDCDASANAYEHVPSWLRPEQDLTQEVA